MSARQMVKRIARAAVTGRDDSVQLAALISLGLLRELRMRTPAISQRELARACRLTLRRIDELERGRGKRVTAKECAAITRALYPQESADAVCRVCGCTDEYGYDVGCAWANAEHTLCTACVGSNERVRQVRGAL